jgi:hypothetical protein
VTATSKRNRIVDVPAQTIASGVVGFGMIGVDQPGKPAEGMELLAIVKPDAEGVALLVQKITGRMARRRAHPRNAGARAARRRQAPAGRARDAVALPQAATQTRFHTSVA